MMGPSAYIIEEKDDQYDDRKAARTTTDYYGNARIFLNKIARDNMVKSCLLTSPPFLVPQLEQWKKS